MVVLAVKDLLKAANGILELHVLTGRAGEGFGYVEGLRQEPLDLSRTRHGHLVVLRQLVHPEDRNDVLKIFITLQHGLNTASDLVMFLADDLRIKNTGGGIQRIDRRINPQLSQ